jgi:hypothetical protein
MKSVMRQKKWLNVEKDAGKVSAARDRASGIRYLPSENVLRFTYPPFRTRSPNARKCQFYTVTMIPALK